MICSHLRKQSKAHCPRRANYRTSDSSCSATERVEILQVELYQATSNQSTLEPACTQAPKSRDQHDGILPRRCSARRLSIHTDIPVQPQPPVWIDCRLAYIKTFTLDTHLYSTKSKQNYILPHTYSVLRIVFRS